MIPQLASDPMLCCQQQSERTLITTDNGPASKRQRGVEKDGVPSSSDSSIPTQIHVPQQQQQQEQHGAAVPAVAPLAPAAEDTKPRVRFAPITEIHPTNWTMAEIEANWYTVS
jgi:hypothetical protein